jgi:protein-L-isoaspartate(D-aspartate) O-methyltransferase
MDIERARFNMIEQQIRPWSVLDPDVLSLLSAVRREAFVPGSLAAMAFADLELPLSVGGRATGEVMLAPKVEARLLQELHVRRHESVLEIGAGSGYMAALLAHQARQVDTLEIDTALAGFARDNLARAAVNNAKVIEADGSKDHASLASYDIIVVSGSIPFVPESLLDRLNPGGRLVAITGDLPVMHAHLSTRDAGGQVSTRMLFETVTRRLHGFAAKPAFAF